MTRLEKDALLLLKNIELFIRVNAPMNDGCSTHKAIKKLIAKAEGK